MVALDNIYINKKNTILHFVPTNVILKPYLEAIYTFILFFNR